MIGRKIKIMQDNKTYEVILAKNQKLIQINKKQNGINFQANYEALERLNSNTYKLYMYLMLHDDNRVWVLSCKDVCKRCDMGDNTYLRAVKELIEQGYLVKGKIDTGTEIVEENAYQFYETPKTKTTIVNGRRYY